MPLSITAFVGANTVLLSAPLKPSVNITTAEPRSFYRPEVSHNQLIKKGKIVCIVVFQHST